MNEAAFILSTCGSSEMTENCPYLDKETTYIREWYFTWNFINRGQRRGLTRGKSPIIWGASA